MSSLLIVEDSFDVAEALQEIFVAEGFDVRIASDGREGLALIREQLPDLVVTDFMMPFMDGLALVQEIRSDPALAQLPVIVMSAARPTLSLDPCTTFIGKPFDFDKIIKLVNHILQK